MHACAHVRMRPRESQTGALATAGPGWGEGWPGRDLRADVQLQRSFSSCTRRGGRRVSDGEQGGREARQRRRARRLSREGRMRKGGRRTQGARGGGAEGEGEGPGNLGPLNADVDSEGGGDLWQAAVSGSRKRCGR
eukprot:1166269-Rhodomonas_salina.4